MNKFLIILLAATIPCCIVLASITWMFNGLGAFILCMVSLACAYAANNIQFEISFNRFTQARRIK